MFKGTMTRNGSGLYTNNGLVYAMLWGLEGKRWDTDKARYVKILPYADVVYVAVNGDMWYYAPQNNVAMPVVRTDDRDIVWGLMSTLGIEIGRTHTNQR